MIWTLDLLHGEHHMYQMFWTHRECRTKLNKSLIHGEVHHVDNEAMLRISISQVAPHTGVIGPVIDSDVPWLDCPASNAMTCVITE